MVVDAMPQTLAQAHEALMKIRPSHGASLSTWRAFRQLAAHVYTEMADIDRFHHHEALYWAGYERSRAEEITKQLGLSGKQRAVQGNETHGIEGE